MCSDYHLTVELYDMVRSVCVCVFSIVSLTCKFIEIKGVKIEVQHLLFQYTNSIAICLTLKITHTPMRTHMHYTKGNVILTDHVYTILNLLRPRTDTDTDIRFAVRETYTMDTIKQEQPPPTLEA